MAFDATTQIFNYMERVTAEFVASNLRIIITAITPIVALGLTMSLMVDGLYMLVRPTGEPLGYLFRKFVRWAIIISIASAGGWYQKSLADVALKTPDEFASILILDGEKGDQKTQIASTIDKALERGIRTAQTAFDNASVFSGPGLASLVLAVVVALCTVLMCGVGAGFILMAKFLLGITVCFGPIFIFCLLFKSTAGLFARWLGTIINYGLVTVLLSAVFGMMMAFYEKAIEAAAAENPSAPIIVPIITCGLITVVSWFVLKQVPEMAQRWGDGISAAVPKMSFSGAPSGQPTGTPTPAQSPVDTTPAGGPGSGGAGTAAALSEAKEAGSAMTGMARGSRR